MFKRGPIIAVGIVVVLLLAAPLAVGMFIQNGLNNQIEIYDRNAMMSASVDSYERGYLSSTANVKIGISQSYLEQMAGMNPSFGLAAMMGDLSIPIIVDFSHGPVLLEIITSASKNGVVATMPSICSSFFTIARVLILFAYT